MTTSDMRTALRRALVTLEGSLHSDVGSPLNPIDELATPEERLAARLVQRLSLRPPIDVYRLALFFASITEKSFPLEMDGLCLDLKMPGKRPKIWLSRDIGRVRRRFTLAHEIGHIVIPWHIGTIIDVLDEPRRSAQGSYRRMEAEANRFAAELLMPSSWVKELVQRSDHIAGMMHTIVQRADVSYPAALYRAEKFGPPGYVGAEIQNGVVVWSGKTKQTSSRPPPVGAPIESIDMPVAYEPEVLSNEGSDYYWWKMREAVHAPDQPNAPWRKILEKALSVVPPEHRFRTRIRINAIIGNAFGKVPRGSPVADIFRSGLEASQNRSDRDRWVAEVVSHPDYRDYVLARAYERTHAK